MATDASSVPLPDVMKATIRPDIVTFVHGQISNNVRQPYAVPRRILGYWPCRFSYPRVPGGSTHRIGQGAFGNMCRDGCMFALMKIWHRWHRAVNVTQKRHAVVFAIAASAIPSLVLARGYKIEEVPELPLVVSDTAEAVEKTNAAIKVLKQVGAFPDAEAFSCIETELGYPLDSIFSSISASPIAAVSLDQVYKAQLKYSGQVVAVKVQRSGAPPAHHQRQHSDNFQETSSNGRWLQSASLQHLRLSNNTVPSVQNFGYYNGGSDLFEEPLTPPGNSGRKNGEEQIFTNEYSPGLFGFAFFRH